MMQQQRILMRLEQGFWRCNHNITASGAALADFIQEDVLNVVKVPFL
jgi:hypothetical protein